MKPLFTVFHTRLLLAIAGLVVATMASAFAPEPVRYAAVFALIFLAFEFGRMCETGPENKLDTITTTETPGTLAGNKTLYGDAIATVIKLLESRITTLKDASENCRKLPNGDNAADSYLIDAVRLKHVIVELKELRDQSPPA